ncbi:MAG: peroxidase [Lewinellaceae bacterium]|nr:peroxidase [Lewinellaceae bacterium]
MSHNGNHHGMYSFPGKNVLNTMESFCKESYGQFGRMFRDLQPLYVKPKDLMGLGAVGGPMDSGNTQEFTANVPLGMIFFGQFIDHDITFDTSSSFSNINNPNDISNTRTPKLDLDCIFGGGPEDEPFMYQKETVGLYLLTGKTNNNSTQNANLEKHDLPRTGKDVAIIGDPRNDENRIISQLQLAMIRFYNAWYDEIKNNPLNSSLSPADIYKEARKQTTWHYQWIVVNEFLPALCGQNIVSDILSNGRRCYLPVHSPYIPVEFSVAAYRFGHSMIAQKIKLQPAGALHNLFSNQIGLGFSKITNQNQVIDWDAFFNFSAVGFQKAEKLNSKLASDLLNLPFVPSPNPSDKSLAVRNLRRGQSFLLPSGENVARSIGVSEPIIGQVKNLINNYTSPLGIDFTHGTPLWYYILCEAEEIGRDEGNGVTLPGEGLGPVGARIVAEVILGLLELDTDSYLGQNRDWSPAGGIYSMKDVIDKSLTAIEL